MLKLVTVLFADVVSSTEHGERMHAEDMRALLSDYFEAMTEEIQAEGGAVEKFVGDAIMAVFGVPLAHEDDAARAVRAARRMLARLTRWNVDRSPRERLEIRIGINTGEVLVAGAARADLLVTGDPVNVASRLERAADPGRIVVGERTAQLVSRLFELRALGPLRLRGRSEPVDAWAVVGDRAQLEPGGGRGLAAPMIGREREFAVLKSTLAHVEAEDRPHLITIVGDPGVGKSRLVTEFVNSLGTGRKLLAGHCLAYGEGVTLWPLGEILKAAAAIPDNDAPETALRKVAELVGHWVPPGLAPDMERTTAALASTLGLESGSRQPAPREAYRELVAAWRVFLAGTAAVQPLVVVIEDLHWADETMLELLEDLAGHVEGPVLFLSTARPEIFRLRPDWGGGKHNYSSVDLAPLSAGESASLVSLLLETDKLPEPVERRILDSAEGNPFFLEEIVRRLIDGGLLERAEGRWRMSAEPAALEIPATVQGVILARIDLLSPSERRALQQASVIGRVFWRGALATLVGADDLDEILHTLCRRELVVEQLSSSIASEAEYVFKHGLTHDVAYGSLPRRDRAQAHRAVAAWIEEVSGTRSAEAAELLAHHYDVAFSLSQDDDLRRSARRHYLAASQAVVRRFALAQAERLARRGVELSAPGSERAEALEALGDLFASAHSGDDAWLAYTDALGAIEDDRAAHERLAAKASIQATRWFGGMSRHPTGEELERLIRDGLEAAGEGDGVWRTLLLMSRGFELICGYPGAERLSDEAAHEALAIAERLEDPDLLSGALDAVGSLLLARGLYGEHLPFVRRRVALVPRLTDVAEVGDAFVMGAWSATYVGRYTEAADYATTCIERARGVDPGEYVHGLAWRAGARTMLGDWAGALEDQVELDRIHAETRAELPSAYTLRAYSAAAFVKELRGETAAATAYLNLVQRCIETQPTAARLDRDAAVALAARTLARRGRVDEARALFGSPEGLRAPPSLEALCEIVAAEDDREAALDVVAAARRQAEISEALALPLFADRLEARLAAAGEEPEQAARLLRRSAAGFAELGARWEEAYSRLLLGEVLLQSGSEREAHRELEQAHAAFELAGSIEESARAEALLAGVVSQFSGL
jgi:class 3 adenylate cyclase